MLQRLDASPPTLVHATMSDPSYVFNPLRPKQVALSNLARSCLTLSEVADDGLKVKYSSL
jgi:hypothetical protein